MYHSVFLDDIYMLIAILTVRTRYVKLIVIVFFMYSSLEEKLREIAYRNL